MTSPVAPVAAASVAFQDVVKRYGETQALDGLTMEARGGRIVGIAGPNGAGKSTAVKVLAGEVPADAGHVLIDGRPWDRDRDARAVAVVHQEPQLFGNLTAMDNLLVGREHSRLARPRGTGHERELLTRFGIERHADRQLATLPLAVQQRVEIVRALAFDARVVLFDEPNSALTADESRALFGAMHQLANEGRVVLLVSHRLGELVEHAAEVVVILDGRVSERLSGAGLNEEALARAITVTTGIADDGGPVREASGPVILSVDGWTHRRRAFGPVSLSVAAGEVIAIVGVEGSGARELVRSLAGLEPAAGDFKARGGGHGQATGYVPPDRRTGLYYNFDVGHNLVSRLDRSISGPLWMRSRSRSERAARAWIERMRVKTPGPRTWIGALSGGNQQKVLTGAAMAPEPAILVLEEPTRGVDIGSKRDIYHHLHDFAASNGAVVVYCTEIPEVFELADRCHVMVAGRLSESFAVRSFRDEKHLAAEVARLEVLLAREAVGRVA